MSETFDNDSFDYLISAPMMEDLGLIPSGQAKGGTGFGHEAPIQGATNEWYTPASIFKAIGLRFDIDPCTPPGGLPWIPADKFYSQADDGLAQPWQGRIWCNPPYGPATRKWLKRMHEHRHGIALVFARTDTEWYHLYAKTADAILFLDGRIRFVDSTGEPPVNSKGQKNTAGAGSMLVAWGADCVDALRKLGDIHHFVPRVPASDDFEGLL